MNWKRTPKPDLATDVGALQRQVQHLEKELLELRKACDEARRVQVRLDEVTANSREWVWEVNVAGNYTYVSTAVEKVLGYQPGELLDSSMFTLFPTAEREDTRTAMLGFFNQKEPFRSFLHRKVHKDGTAIMTVSSGVPVFDAAGNVTGYRGADADITARNRAEKERLRQEQQLYHVQKFKSLQKFAGGIAHDFNNILMIILGNVDLVLMDLPEGAPEHDMIQDLKIAAQRMERLCQGLTEYAGKSDVNIEPVAINELLEPLIDKLRREGPPQIKLEASLAANLPPAKLDRRQVPEVLSHLLTNAVEALEGNGGTIHISSGSQHFDMAALVHVHLCDGMAEGMYVVVSIADTGPGIPEDVLPLVFDPFFSTKPRHKGRGLARALSVVQAHGGGIRVSSTPHKGTTVTVLFPADAQ